MSRKNYQMPLSINSSSRAVTAPLQSQGLALLTTDILSVNVLIILGLVLIITNAALNA